MAVPMVSSSGVIFGGFKRYVSSFRVAGVAHSWHFDVFGNVSKIVLRAGSVLWQHCQQMCCIFRGKRNTFDLSSCILRGRHSTSDVASCLFCANRIVRAARGGDKVLNIDFEERIFKF